MSLIDRDILVTSLPTSFKVAFEIELVAASYTDEGWALSFGVGHRLLDPRFAIVKVTVTTREIEAIGLNSIRDLIYEKAEEAFVHAVKQWQEKG